MGSFTHQPAIDEDRDVLPNFPLIIQNVSSCSGVTLKYDIQRLAKRVCVDRFTRTIDVMFQVGCEFDRWHG